MTPPIPIEAAAILAVYHGAMSLLACLGLHRCWLLRRAHRLPAPLTAAPAPPAEWPDVLVQLPLYNEPHVAERVIAAAAAMDYEAGRVELQVLDDSTDPDARAAVDRAVQAAAAGGHRITLLRRERRAGYKAGALAAGLLASPRAPIIVIFDADFIPPAGFLRHAVAALLAARDVGFVQACWGHLNRNERQLTQGQALLLDAHFHCEHAVRSHAGLIFNFNGTAGAWRRAAIEAAGGWQGDTLTEDFDLSYRARMAGWRGLLLPGLAAPAELPAAWSALRGQQSRWTRGSLQCARKLLGPLWRSELPFAVKVEATVPLLANLAWPMLLLLMVLAFPVFVIRQEHNLAALLWVDVLMLGPATLAFLAYYASAARRRGSPLPVACIDAVRAMLLGIALAPNNARAALLGLVPMGGTFLRTPKSGGVAGARRSRRRGDVLWFAEAALLVYLLALVLFIAGMGVWIALPFVLFFALGTAWSFAEGAAERWRP